MVLNTKQTKTLRSIFETPLRSDICWNDIVSLLNALGADITQGSGSRVRVYLNKERAVFHEPHPERVTDKGAVKSMKEFLQNAGVDEGEEKGERDVDTQGLQGAVRG